MHQYNTKTGSKLVKGIYIILMAVLVAVIIKSFIFDAYKIPTGSMENTLLSGDFIIVSKLSYALSTPRYVPFTEIPLPYYKLVEISKPEVNDVIVFEFPGNKNELKPVAPVNYIKRLIALPGDKVEINKKVVYVNDSPVTEPLGMKQDTILKKNGARDPGIFFNDESWNQDFYGPVKVPKAGSVIQLNLKNIKTWGMVINREYGRNVVSVEGTVITIDAKPVREYTFKKNYYFVLGDNRSDSMDSRYWGFVPEDAVVGEAVLVYWSLDPSVSESDPLAAFKSLRIDRIFSIVH